MGKLSYQILWEHMKLLQTMPLLLLLLGTTLSVPTMVSVDMKRKGAEVGGSGTGGITGVEAEGEETSEDESRVRVRNTNPETNWIKALTELMTDMKKHYFKTEVLVYKSSQP